MLAATVLATLLVRTAYQGESFFAPIPRIVELSTATLAAQGVNYHRATHRAVAQVKLPSGRDVVKYDPGPERIYVACYSGFIAVIQQQDPTHFVKLADVPVPAKVHSLAVDGRTHRVYAPEQEADGKPVARMTVYDAVP